MAPLGVLQAKEKQAVGSCPQVRDQAFPCRAQRAQGFSGRVGSRQLGCAREQLVAEIAW